MTSAAVQDIEGAKAYLSKHNLHGIFESLASDVLNARPDDPLPFLYAKLGELLPADKKSASPPPPARPPNEPQPAAEPAPAEEVPKPAAAPAKVPPQQTHKIAFVLGGPGSGKGTQCAKLVEKFGFLHVSAGDLLREEAAKDTDQGKQIAAIMEEGKIVPGHVTIGLLKAWIAGRPPGSTILIDGFPREIRQALDFERDIMPCMFVLSFVAGDQTLENRLVERGLTSGRADDNLVAIKKRLVTFHQETHVVTEYFRALDRLREVNAEGDVESVFEETAKLF